ncbi:hypothetical protein [Citrobacter braakii]|uniref:hypothetical protein n=1 Tax=Citrobacter braakii TaxID=57706 RepID=UPI004039F03B
MKWIVVFAALLLGGCQATLISYNGKSQSAECPPVLRVTSFGNTVTITDGSECKKEIKE